jgi:hypothetical protein
MNICEYEKKKKRRNGAREFALTSFAAVKPNLTK